MIKRIIIKIVVIIVAAILTLAGVGFFVSSLYLYLQMIFENPPMAAFLCGLTLLLIAILCLLVIFLYKGRGKKVDLSGAVTSKLPTIDDAFDLVKQHPLQTSAVALAIGFIFGFSPKVRDKVIETVGSYLNCQNSEKNSE